MARETRLDEIIRAVEASWGRDAHALYFYVDSRAAAGSQLSRGVITSGRWPASANLLTEAVRWLRRRGGGGGGGGGPDADVGTHRVAVLDLPARPGTPGEGWDTAERRSHGAGMRWNTWLRLKMKAMLEISNRNPNPNPNLNHNHNPNPYPLFSPNPSPNLSSSPSPNPNPNPNP